MVDVNKIASTLSMANKDYSYFIPLFEYQDSWGAVSCCYFSAVYSEVGSPREIERHDSRSSIIYDRATGWWIDNLTERELVVLRTAFPQQFRLGIPGRPFKFGAKV